MSRTIHVRITTGMKRLIFTLLLGCFVVTAEQLPPPAAIHITLTDGSELRGAPLFKCLPVHTAFADVEIELAMLASAEFDPAAKTVQMTLQNGDRLRGTPLVTELALQAAFGKVNLSLLHVKRLVTEGTEASAGLILHYHFDRDADGAARNEVTDRHHGVFKAARWVADGKRGGAVRIPGNGATVLIPHHPQLDFGRDDFSYALWFKADEIGSRQQLFWHSYNPEVQIEPDGKLLAFFAYRFCGGFSSAGAVEAGQWNHVVVTREKGTGTLYVNGQKEATVEAANCDASSPDPLLLGSDTGGAEPFRGLIDEFSIWRRALSEAEVRSLFQREQPITPTAR